MQTGFYLLRNIIDIVKYSTSCFNKENNLGQADYFSSSSYWFYRNLAFPDLKFYRCSLFITTNGNCETILSL